MDKHLFLSLNIVVDNESAVAKAISEKNYVQAFLLIYSLVESLLRVFFNLENKDVRFDDLIKAYESYLVSINYPERTFVEELKKFNQRRNRIVHELWKKGYSGTNEQAEDTANSAVLMYGLFIEWLQTFDENISDRGFKLSEDI